jgi:hypothetical protein
MAVICRSKLVIEKAGVVVLRVVRMTPKASTAAYRGASHAITAGSHAILVAVVIGSTFERTSPR